MSSFFQINSSIQHQQQKRLQNVRPSSTISFFSADSITHSTKGLLDLKTIFEIEETIRRIEEKARKHAYMKWAQEQALKLNKQCGTFNPMALAKRVLKPKKKQNSVENVDEIHDKITFNLTNPQLPLVKREKNLLVRTNSGLESIQTDLRQVHAPITKQIIDIFISKPIQLDIIIDHRHLKPSKSNTILDLPKETLAEIDRGVARVIESQRKPRVIKEIVYKDEQAKIQNQISMLKEPKDGSDFKKLRKAIVKRVYQLPDKVNNGQLVLMNQTCMKSNNCMDPYELVFCQQNMMITPCIRTERSFKEIVSIEDVPSELTDQTNNQEIKIQIPYKIPRLPLIFTGTLSMRRNFKNRSLLRYRRLKASIPPINSPIITQNLTYLQRKLFKRSRQSNSDKSNSGKLNTSNATLVSTTSKINRLFQFLNEHEKSRNELQQHNQRVQETHPIPLRDVLQSALINFVQTPYENLFSLSYSNRQSANATPTYDRRAKNFGWF